MNEGCFLTKNEEEELAQCKPSVHDRRVGRRMGLELGFEVGFVPLFV